MHLSSIELKNIRLFRELKWEIGARPGWNVVIGDNGSGKTAFLRAISAALVGRQNAEALRQDWGAWLNVGQTVGIISISAVIATDSLFFQIPLLKLNGKVLFASRASQFAEPAEEDAHDFISSVKRILKGSHEMSLQKEADKKTEFEQLLKQLRPFEDFSINKASMLMSGSFSAAFGPFRRFTGSDKDSEEIFRNNKELARHLSLFGENIPLAEALNWLQKLRFKELEEKRDGSLLGTLCEFINQEGFLPRGLRMDQITSDDVNFVDANGFKLPVTSLSDGFRSVLSFAFELLYQMSNQFGHENLFERGDSKITVKQPGVVLVDEIDAHMHPTWQRRIGFWLTEHFPKLQFIVSTHSPLVCQAAEKGSIFRLAAPGTDEPSKEVTGVDRDRLVFGSVLDAYGTELFGKDITLSESALKKQELLAELNQKAFFGNLSDEEKGDRAELLKIFPANF